MEKIYSLKDPEILLHIVYRITDFKNNREDIIDDNNFLQLSSLKMKEGKTFRPHRHIVREGPRYTIAQESWVIVRGSVSVFYYDLDNSLIKEVVLNQGDCTITLDGGHTYKSLDEDTLVYEFKTGPYTGQENDKIFIDADCKSDYKDQAQGEAFTRWQEKYLLQQ